MSLTPFCQYGDETQKVHLMEDRHKLAGTTLAALCPCKQGEKDTTSREAGSTGALTTRGEGSALLVSTGIQRREDLRSYGLLASDKVTTRILLAAIIIC